MLTIRGRRRLSGADLFPGIYGEQPRISRYYAFQSLFAWAMMNKVIAGSMLQLFVFWEMVGLASYFLIGFYYEKRSASQAGKKAFVMNRVGDVGFFLGPESGLS